MSQRAAFIGLGVMGFPMAGFLQQKGYETTVFNRTSAKADDWAAQYGGKTAATPREAAEGADLVMACVGNDDDLRGIVLGDDGAFAGMKSGAIFVDHTTASADVARELAEVGAAKGLGFVDAPVSGGQAGAEGGFLTVMCGGDNATYEAARPAIMSYARACERLGEVGAGQLTKMVNQICIAGVVQGLSEALHFADKAGLDGRAVIDVISKGAAQSWQMENRYETMIDDKFDYGFAVDWMRKDLGICLSQARSLGTTLPMVGLVDQFYGDVQAMGGGRWDTSSLIRRLRAHQRSYE